MMVSSLNIATNAILAFDAVMIRESGSRRVRFQGECVGVSLTFCVQ